MKQTLNVSDFRDAFARAGRKEQFSYHGLGLLFDYLEECDPNYDLDVIALCCDFTEETAVSIAADYSIDIEGLDEDEAHAEVLEYLQDETCVVGHTDDGRIVYANY